MERDFLFEVAWWAFGRLPKLFPVYYIPFFFAAGSTTNTNYTAAGQKTNVCQSSKRRPREMLAACKAFSPPPTSIVWVHGVMSRSGGGFADSLCLCVRNPRAPFFHLLPTTTLLWFLPQFHPFLNLKLPVLRLVLATLGASSSATSPPATGGTKASAFFHKKVVSRREQLPSCSSPLCRYWTCAEWRSTRTWFDFFVSVSNPSLLKSCFCSQMKELCAVKLKFSLRPLVMLVADLLSVSCSTLVI
jgi:hypothetical protein